MKQMENKNVVYLCLNSTKIRWNQLHRWFTQTRRYKVKRYNFKGSVGVILSNPSFIECHVRFTTVPLKALSGQ